MNTKRMNPSVSFPKRWGWVFIFGFLFLFCGTSHGIKCTAFTQKTTEIRSQHTQVLEKLTLEDNILFSTKYGEIVLEVFGKYLKNQIKEGETQEQAYRRLAESHFSLSFEFAKNVVEQLKIEYKGPLEGLSPEESRALIDIVALTMPKYLRQLDGFSSLNERIFQAQERMQTIKDSVRAPMQHFREELRIYIQEFLDSYLVPGKLLGLGAWGIIPFLGAFLNGEPVTPFQIKLSIAIVTLLPFSMSAIGVFIEGHDLIVPRYRYESAKVKMKWAQTVKKWRKWGLRKFRRQMRKVSRGYVLEVSEDKLLEQTVAEVENQVMDLKRSHAPRGQVHSRIGKEMANLYTSEVNTLSGIGLRMTLVIRLIAELRNDISNVQDALQANFKVEDLVRLKQKIDRKNRILEKIQKAIDVVFERNQLLQEHFDQLLSNTRSRKLDEEELGLLGEMEFLQGMNSQNLSMSRANRDAVHSALGITSNSLRTVEALSKNEITVHQASTRLRQQNEELAELEALTE